jgi:hypothetical protein
VEEQGAATPEISRKQAAQRAQQVSSSITDAQQARRQRERIGLISGLRGAVAVIGLNSVGAA